MYSHLAEVINKRFRIDAHYFLKGGFWLSVAQFSTIGFGVISTALFAHFLDEYDYGIYRYLVGISVMLASFSLTGLGQSVLQTTAQKFSNFYKETLKINFLFSLLITVVALTGAGYYWFNHNTVLTIGCLMVAFLQPLITTFQNTQHYLQGSQQYKTSTTLHVTRMIITTILSVSILFVTKNILVLFFFYLLGLLIANAYGHLRYAPKENSPTPQDVLARYLNYAKHSSLRNAVANIAQRADTIIVFTQLGAAELALYTIATVIPEQIKGSFKNLAALLLPKYARQTDKRQILNNAPKRSFQLLGVLFIITILFMITAPLLYGFIFPKYPEAARLSQILALSFPAMISIIPVGILQSQIAEKKLYQIQIIESVFLVLLMLMFTTLFGVMGAVFAKVMTRYISTTLNFILLLESNLFLLHYKSSTVPKAS